MYQEATKARSLFSKEIDLFQAPIDDLCHYGFMDFAQKTATFLLPPALASIYSKISGQYDSHRRDKFNRYYFYLTILVFMLRDVPFAEKIVKRYLEKENPDQDMSKSLHDIRQKLKELTVLEAMEYYWENHSKKKRMELLDGDKEFFLLCRKIQNDKMMQRNKIVIANELERICGFKRCENPKEYGRVRKYFLRFRKKFQSELFKDLHWPSEAFNFFITMLRWRFVESFPGCYVLISMYDTDVKVNMLQKLAFEAANRNPRGNSPPPLYSKLLSDYKKLKVKFDELQTKENNGNELGAQLKKIELTLIRRNTYAVWSSYHKTLYSSEEQDEILLRYAMLGNADAAGQIGWKALGFLELPIEISPRGKLIRTRKILVASGFKCIPAQTRLHYIEFDLWLPEKPKGKHEFLNEFCDESQASIQRDFYRSIINCNNQNQQSTIFAHYKIPATPDNFSRLMQIADIFPHNFTFTLQFEGRLKKVVFLLERNEKLSPPRT